MPRRRPQQTLLGSLRKTIWGTGLRKSITVTGGAIAAVAGAITATNAAYPIIEPGMPALHYYVQGEVSPLHKRVINLELAQNDDRRQRLIDGAAKREIELQGAQAKQLPQYRALVQQRVDRVKEELKMLDAKDKSLFNEQKSK